VVLAAIALLLTLALNTMEKVQFLNHIRAGTNQIHDWDLEQYFKDYTGPYDESVADDYVRYFNNNPKELAQHAQNGISHRQSLIENGMLKVNNPFP
jgi:uncharacterized protein YwgA